MGGGLLCYEGPRYTDITDHTIVVHLFTVVKPLNTITRNVKSWDKYRLTDNWGLNRLKNCMYFKRGVFKLMKYEKALTVLNGNRL